ncbi:MAG: LptF/LptG family permease [Planctomycetota bacterium]
MMLFQRRLFLELLRNTGTTLGLLTLVLLLISCAQVIHAKEGLTLVSFLHSVPIFALAPLDVTLPLAVLVAVILTYGRWAADNEIDTLSASGVSPLHLLTPGLLFGSLMALVLLVGMDYVKPLVDRTKRLMAEDIASLLRSRLSAGEPVKLDDRTVISAEEFDSEGRALRFRLQLYSSDGQLETELVAQQAELRIDETTRVFELELSNFRVVVGSEGSGHMTIRRPLGRGLPEFYEKHLTTPQLLAFLGRAPEYRLDITEVEARLAVHLRLANSMACLIFVLIGVPAALLFRRNDRTGAFLLAFLIALFLHYPSQQVAIALSKSGRVSPELAIWSGSAVLAMLGGALLARVFRR